MINIIKSRFHRNGVSGEPFFCIQFRYSELEGGKQKELIATGTGETSFCLATFRVINALNIDDCQRGDCWANDFNNAFKESGAPTLYDWLGPFDIIYCEVNNLQQSKS